MEENMPRTLRQRAQRLDALPHIAPTAIDAQGRGRPLTPKQREVLDSVGASIAIMRQIDNHFFGLCAKLLLFGQASPQCLVDAIENLTKLEEKRQKAKEYNLKIPSELAKYIHSSLNNKELLQYWAIVIDCVTLLERETSMEWRTWIRELETLSNSLIAKICLGVPLIKEKNMTGLISTIEFLDDILDREFTNIERGLGKRKVHLGEAINQKIMWKIRVNPGFIERRPSEPVTTEPEMTKGYHTVRAIVLLSTLLGIIPGYLAWGSSPHLRGTTNDADFWSLIQSLVIQLQNVLIIVASIWMRKDLSFKGWFWTWVFLSLSCACPAAAVVLYVYMPTEWSAALAFLGAAAQSFVFLQSSFNKTKGKEKIV